MKRICLLAALAGLCGCSHVDRTPIVPMAAATPTNNVTSPPPPLSSATVNPPLRQISSDERPPGEGDYTDTRIPADRSIVRRCPKPSAPSTASWRTFTSLTINSSFRRRRAASLQRDAQLLHEILLEFPQLQVTVEGHCDERGSAEYNIGLGDRRAKPASLLLLAKSGCRPAISRRSVTAKKRRNVPNRTSPAGAAIAAPIS
jgi:outer membrane protein OmpA-like peptidoglycan-associated protein